MNRRNLRTHGILAATFLALLLTACGKDETQLGNDPAIQDFGDLAIGDPTTLVGRQFDLRGLRATRVVGDYVFWAGVGGDEVPVVLESELNGSGQETAVQIRRGRNYAMRGFIWA